MREGTKKQNCCLTYGDCFSLSFNFLMWGLRKLHSIMPKVLLHFKNVLKFIFLVSETSIGRLYLSTFIIYLLTILKLHSRVVFYVCSNNKNNNKIAII